MLAEDSRGLDTQETLPRPSSNVLLARSVIARVLQIPESHLADSTPLGFRAVTIFKTVSIATKQHLGRFHKDMTVGELLEQVRD